jgi:hypothetical protein
LQMVLELSQLDRLVKIVEHPPVKLAIAA